MNPRIVGRSDTAMSDKPAVCLNCGRPFKFGTNVFTHDGWKEISISGMCESCFDGLFEEEESQHESIVSPDDTVKP